MRRPASLLALLLTCLFVTACGGDDDPAVTPLGDALGYFAEDERLVAVVETDPGHDQVKRLSELAGRFPVGSLVGERVREATHFRSVEFDRDIRPLLGQPLVVGMVGSSGTGTRRPGPIVTALRVPKPNAAKRFVLRHGFAARGTARGVGIHENLAEGRWAAVDGDVLLLANDRAAIEGAITRRRGDDHMTERGFARDVKGLPPSGLLRVSADPRALMASVPRLRAALEAKWIDSMRRTGAVLKLVDTGVTLDLAVQTDADRLGDADLPLAPRPGPIPLVGGRGDVKAGAREPARIARFVADLWNRLAPRRAERLRSAAAGRVDWGRVVRHLGDVGVVAVDPFTRRFAGRVAVTEPGDVRDGLTRIAPALPDIAPVFGWRGVGLATPEAGENFYALATPQGRTLVFGVLGSSLVAASEADRAAGIVSEATQEAKGGPASALLTLNARELVGTALGRLLGGPAAFAAQFAVAPLRDLTARATISRERLRVTAKLTLVN